jgi:outer membrane protein OmpA-like peptidoglycan-associated protein
MKKNFVLSLLIVAVSMLFVGSGIAQAQKAQKDAGPMYAITYGKGIILTSPGGEAWTERDSGTNVPLADVEFAKERFVAVGGSGKIVTGSRDGTTWSIQQSGVTSDLWAVKFAKGLFVAVGSEGTVISSPDGFTWTKRANLVQSPLRNLCFGKEQFIAIGAGGSIFSSPDGIYWARRSSQHTDDLHGITYAKGILTAVGGNGRILTSSDDGVTWTERYSGTSEELQAISYGKGKYVAVGANGTIVTSPDSRNWTAVRSGSQDKLAAVTFARKLFVVVASNGSALESPDGTNWTTSRYGRTAPPPVAMSEPIARPAPEPMAREKVEEKVVVVAPVSEPKVEEKVMVAAAEPKVTILAFENVHFDFDKSNLNPETQAILKRNIRVLKDNPESKVRLAGYTSASGTQDYNQKLSERRASAVQEYLVNEGVITRDRLSTIGYGETNPAMYEATPKERYTEAAKANMRVLFEIVAR